MTEPIEVGFNYLDQIQGKLTELKNSIQSLQPAVNALTETISQGGLIYVFGTGHAHMMAEEMFYRAGGLANVYPILIPELMLHQNASMSTKLERDPNQIGNILKNYELNEKDILILVSNSGGNPLITTLSKKVQERGLKVIAITSLKHSRSATSKTANNEKLADIADYVIDNQGEVGDALISFTELESNAGPTSTVLGATIINLLSIMVIQNLLNQGLSPQVFKSSNTVGGDEWNEEILNNFRKRIKIL